MNKVTEFRKDVYRCLELANIKYGLYDLIDKSCINKDISIDFYVSTSGGDAGWASHYYEGDKIKRLALRFNSFYIESHYDYMSKETIPHEIAHLLCYLMYPKQNINHGQEWYDLCVGLGGNGARYHKMTNPIVKKKYIEYEYDVDGSIIYVSSKVHIKAQKSFTNHVVNGKYTRLFKSMYTGKTYMVTEKKNR